ncbi:MAG: restriction endonuclease subunit S [Anaerolineales bacterium]
MTAPIPKGYKRTEVGVIPEEWEVKPLKNIAKVKGGKRLPKGFVLVSVPTSHPYIRVSDMFMGGVNAENLLYVPNEAYRYIQDYRIYSADIFISVAGSLGIVGKIPQELDGANLTENADRITEISCDRDYLLYCLSSRFIQQLIQSYMTIGAQPKLAIARIQEFPVVVPPTIEEQQAIAAALGDVDSLLAALDRLIAKKRAVKAAVMRDLLTGRVRLPGFEGEWDESTLGNVCEHIYKGEQVNRNTLSPDGSYPVWNGGIEPSGFTEKWNTDAFTITISEGGNSCGFVNFVKQKFWLGGHCYALRPKFSIISKEFLFFALKFRESEIMSLRVGSGLPNIQHSRIRALVITFPPLPEQTAIAVALSDLDAELDALERERAKWQAVKQGMMDDLLTGRVRLV